MYLHFMYYIIEFGPQPFDSLNLALREKVWAPIFNQYDPVQCWLISLLISLLFFSDNKGILIFLCKIKTTNLMQFQTHQCN